MQRSEDPGDRQNEASRKVILSGCKAFEKSVEQPASRNETQLRKMHDGQQHVNERVSRLQGEQIGRMGDRLPAADPQLADRHYPRQCHQQRHSLHDSALHPLKHPMLVV
ncbi:hypothetical protein J3T95_08520 [Bifidobacterium sp. B4079]|nr:hypothetical protein [Bifidobacterium sp. B4079]